MLIKLLKNSLFIFSLLCSISIQSQIVIENSKLKLTIESNGNSRSLIYKETGEECLIQHLATPAFSIMQYRPYDNETQLTYVSRPTKFWANEVRRDGDTLFVGFEHNNYTAVISLNITDDYICFTPEYFIEKKKEMGVVGETRIDEVCFLQLPVKNRATYGEWMNVMWDDKIAVSLLATDVHTRVDDIPYDNTYHLMRSAGVKEIKLTKAGAALIVSSKDDFLDCVESVENDYNLPKGVKARRNDNIQMSYYECRNVNIGNVDEHIKYALQGGFRMMVIYYPSFASSMGHFTWRDEYPNGLDDLMLVVDKIKKAGLIPGFHIHYNKAQINDPYVTPIPDSRLNTRRSFTLSKTINKEDSTISVEENPEGITMYEGRRLLKIGNEIIEYSSTTTEYPYLFIGCKRGVLNSTPDSYPIGREIELLDVDNWPIFIRFDQKTSIQDEVADRLKEIVKACGFEFIYFDGAEDVNQPYWFNIGLAMNRVYNKLETKPIFSEGASKTHFNWHILSRGNAFDHFKPEHIKVAVDSICIPAAKYNAASFTGIEFGWIAYNPPSEKTIGIQPDMVEYILSHSVGFNSGLSLVGILDSLEKHPRTNDNLSIFKLWEDAKYSGFFTEEQKRELRKPKKEFILFVNENKEYELLSYEQIIMPKEKSNIRAFIFYRNDKVWVSYWHTSGSGLLELPIQEQKFSLYNKTVKKIKIKGKNRKIDKTIIPIGNIRYLSFDLPKEDVIKLFVHSKLLDEASTSLLK